MIRRALASALSLALGVSAQEAPIGVRGATVYPGDGSKIDNGVVVVHEGRIVAVGPREGTGVPEGTGWIEAAGRFVTPGLIDAHVHYSQTGWVDGRPDARDERARFPYWQTIADCEAHPDRFHLAFLASGVTAVFDVGGYPWTRRLAERTETSPFAPHVAATGALLATYDPPPLRTADRRQFVLIEAGGEDAAREAVRSHAAAGSAAIKVWFIVRAEGELARLEPVVRAVADETAKAGLPLVVHSTSLATARIAVDAGARLLVHSVENRPVDDEFLELAKKRGTFYCPTLTVRAGYFHVYRGIVPDGVRVQLAFVHPSVEERILETAKFDPARGFRNPRVAESLLKQQELRDKLLAENLRKVHEAGIPVVMGTDAGNPMTLHGPSVIPEMVAMQNAGLTPLAVLTASTRDAARAMGRGDDLGLISVGRVADLLVLEKDPAVDIANLASIDRVCRAGVMHTRAGLVDRLRTATR